MKALCVIDVQKDFTKPDRRFAIPQESIETMIKRINTLVDQFSKQDHSIIYIRQVNRSWAARLFSRVFTQGLGIHGNPGCELDSRLEVVSSHIFDKERPSSFSSDQFVSFLKKNQINEIAIVGIDGCFCVAATAKEAIRRGIKVELIEDAIATSFPQRWVKIKTDLKKQILTS